ncbi:transketolase family protein [Planctomycetota bacterium]
MAISTIQTKTMRDALIERIYCRMKENDRIFFVSADMGAPALDKLREDFSDRFVNVGIAEQNLINLAAGLSLEGFTVYAYAIAGFISMRAYEQIRTNLALLSQQRRINVNLIAVGGGVSYDMSGPSHHCLEDLAIIRTLPNIALCSPSDWVVAEDFVDFSINVSGPKYIRLDGKPLPRIYDGDSRVEWEEGFHELASGDEVCIVSTGYMTHKALAIAETLRAEGRRVGVIDMFLLKSFNAEALFALLQKYQSIVTMEEAFVNKGGLDSLVSTLLGSRDSKARLVRLGFKDQYVSAYGSRDFLYAQNQIDDKKIIETISNLVGSI